VKIEILGSGGAITTPQPLCQCKVCKEARIKGVPYSRMGPSIFLHDINLLIDTPEDIGQQLNRSEINSVDYCTYSHWHPDHTMGRRIFEMNKDWRNYPPENKKTIVFIPEGVKPGFEECLGIMEHFNYFQEINIIDIETLTDGQEYRIGEYLIEAIRLEEDYVYGFIISNDTTKVLIIMDELVGWKVPDDLSQLDLAILPAGIFDTNPLTGVQNIAKNHPVLEEECTFKETIEIVKKLNGDRIIMSHIEEADRLSFDDLKSVEDMYREKGIEIEFAYDRMVIEV